MSAAERLRDIVKEPGILIVPGCYDAISARLIERAGFQATFMGGFAVSAARLGMPDAGLISYAEMSDQGRNICAAVSIPVLGDGDTGYGNAMNVQRTVRGYAQAGFACVMIEDQVAPKRCGHTQGKQIVGREEAFMRIQAAVDTAVDARNSGTDILIMARTDALATNGLDEAIFRANKFSSLGADITFVESPRNVEEMRAICASVPGPKMANMVEQGLTPILSPAELQGIGYKIVAYPLTLMLAGVGAMESALACVNRGEPTEACASFAHLREIVGFPEYYEAEKRYESD